MSKRAYKFVGFERGQLHLVWDSDIVESNVCFRNAEHNFVNVMCLYRAKQINEFKELSEGPC